MMEIKERIFFIQILRKKYSKSLVEKTLVDCQVKIDPFQRGKTSRSRAQLV